MCVCVCVYIYIFINKFVTHTYTYIQIWTLYISLKLFIYLLQICIDLFGKITFPSYSNILKHPESHAENLSEVQHFNTHWHHSGNFCTIQHLKHLLIWHAHCFQLYLLKTSRLMHVLKSLLFRWASGWYRKSWSLKPWRSVPRSWATSSRLQRYISEQLFTQSCSYCIDTRYKRSLIYTVWWS